MKKNEVRIGGVYKAKVSGRLTKVRITGESRHGGWDAINVLTNKTVRIKTAARLSGEAQHGKKAKAASKSDPKVVKAVLAEAKTTLARDMAKAKKPRQRADGKMSGLDAAAKVLSETKAPMTTREMFDCVVAKGYWTSDAPTPHNTLYSAILREITKKGDASRFRKAERGKFALRA